MMKSRDKGNKSGKVRGLLDLRDGRNKLKRRDNEIGLIEYGKERASSLLEFIINT